MARFAVRSITLLALLGAMLALPATALATIYVSLEPDSATVQPGDTVTVRLTIFQADAQFNGFDAFVSFDPARLALVSTPLADQVGPVISGACTNLFQSFVAHPDSVEIHLGMLCPATFVTGPGDIYQFRLRVLAPVGPTDLVWSTGTEFFRAGFFVRPRVEVPMTLFVKNLAAVGPSSAAAGLSLETPWPNPYRGSGPLTLHFSLADSAPVGFTIFDTQGRRVASQAPEEFSAGAHSFVWSGLRLQPGRYLVKMRSGSNLQIARAWVVVR
jgi:hypothetical protein